MSTPKYNEALRFVEERAKTAKSWIALNNAFFGVGGKLSQLFPTREDCTAFSQSDQYKRIQEIIESSFDNSESDGPSGQFRLRIPRTLHAALIEEARAEGISLNQLCLSKISLQLRAQV